jgi:hypothetical protein
MAAWRTDIGHSGMRLVPPACYGGGVDQLKVGLRSPVPLKGED